MLSKDLFTPELNLAPYQLRHIRHLQLLQHQGGEINLNDICSPAKNRENLLTNRKIRNQNNKQKAAFAPGKTRWVAFTKCKGTPAKASPERVRGMAIARRQALLGGDTGG